MRLERIELQNFCRHRHLKVEPGAGVVGILGGNGTGKSTVFHALRLALCGSSGTEGKKADDARLGSDPSEGCYVQAVFTHDGHAYDIIRGVRGVASSLSAHGETITTETAIARCLTDAFGMEPAALAEHLFIPQGKLCEAIEATPAERSRLFSRLYGLDRAEAVYQACGEELSALAIPDHSRAIEDAKARTLALENDRAEVVAKVDEYVDVPAQEDDEDRRLAAIVADAAAGDLDRSRRKQALDALKSSEAALDRAIAALEEVELELDELPEADPNVELAKLVLEEWSRYEAAERARKRVELKSTQLDSFIVISRNKLGAEPRVVLAEGPPNSLEQTHPDVMNPAGLIARLSRARDDAASAEKCPTCDRPWEDQTRLQELVKRVKDLESDLERVEAANKHYARRAEALKLQDWIIEREALDSESLELPKKPEMAKADADRMVKAEANRLHHESTIEVRLKAAEAAADKAAAKLEQAEAALLAFGPEPSDQDTALVDEARKAQRDRADCRRMRASLEGRLSELDRGLVSAKASLKALEDEEAAASGLRAFAARVRAARSHLHRDAAPREFLEARLEADLESANVMLEEAGEPFRVKPESGLDLLVRFRGGIEVPAGRLSGGQKAKLAIAVRLAAGAGRVGLICADEPTYGMDRRSVRSTMAAALSHLRTSVTGQELQCIVVTHEEVVADLFDRVIRMGENLENLDPAALDPGPRRRRRRL